jgi:hypothetical protein
MFVKIFTQILDSSIAKDWQVRHVFEDMLKLCDQDGVLDMTPDAIASRTRMPLDLIMRVIPILEAPDPDSRSDIEKGVRIKQLYSHRAWGWHIVNYNYYRNIASDEQRREKTAARVRKLRESRKAGPAGNTPVTHGSVSNATQREKQRETHRQRLC